MSTTDIATDDENTPAPTGLQTLQQLRAYDGTLWVRNNTLNQVHIRTVVAGQRVDVELEPVGRQDSISTLPKAMLELRGFQRLWKRGGVTVSTDPDIEDEITLLMNQHAKTPEQRLADILAKGGAVQTTDTPVDPKLVITGSIQSKALVERACLECGQTSREGVITGGRVIQRQHEVDQGLPPLCDEHEHLTHLYASTQTEDGVVFSKVTVGATRKGI